MTKIPAGSLKCVVMADPRRHEAALLSLGERFGRQEIRNFGEAAILVHTLEDASALRDQLKSAGAVLVVEFETWSGGGNEVPREWLLARGH
jgi:hypothetical protein